MKKFVLILILFIGSINFLAAQNSQELKVEKAVQRLVAAMVSGDRNELNASVSDHLSYGHSGGHVEGKEEFVEKIASGKSDFVTIDIKDQTIHIYGKSAIVRHALEAATNDNGKPANVKLQVLLVFAKENGEWKLLARQAVKPTS
jgi:ketosteroid isomerase-like protein